MIIEEELKLLLKGYDGKEQPRDELWANSRQALPYWEQLLKQIRNLGTEELSNRNLEIQRLLVDNGVSFNLFDQTDKNQRFWQLDPIPFLIAPDFWQTIKVAVEQRVHLMDLIFKDLYGPRKLFKDGILPAELIFADRQFLRACDQIQYPNERAILQYAVDVSRSTDGQLWVIGDRTQAPSGLAYSLENRVAMARAVPEFFAKARVKKLGPYYQKLRQHLLQVAPHQTPDPLVAVLSPGPYSSTYFEHTFMSALQGFELVQGQDLMVKDEYVWLKTLSGLEKVDVIIRHVDDRYCDPLSLRADSQLGVAGLLEVARAGNVTIANPLGSGVLENPGLMAFMPAIARYFLGTDLLLPNIASWWCGQPKELNYVLEHFDQLVIKDLQQTRPGKTIYGWELSSQEKQEWKQKISRFPHRYVGQEQAIFSTAPSWSGEHLEPRSTVLRCFASSGGEDYEVMPGGLTRSAPKLGNSHVSNRSGGLGKDTWVISDEKVKPIRFKSSDTVLRGTYKQLDDLPSRMASQLFWMGRYLMRIKFTARFLRVILKTETDIKNFEDPADNDTWPLLLQGLTHITLTYPGFVGPEGKANLEAPEAQISALLSDYNLTGSLAHSLRMLKNAATAVRNRWAPDTWRMLDQTDQFWEAFSQKQQNNSRSVRRALDQLIDNLAALQGFIVGSLSIEEGRPLLDIGMRLEHGMLLSSLSRALLPNGQDTDVENNLMEAMLVTTESLSSYRHRYRGNLRLAGLLELLLLDDSYPQSLNYSIKVLKENLAQLPSMVEGKKLRLDQKEVLKIYSALQLADAANLLDAKENKEEREHLDVLLGSIYEGLAKTSNEISSTFFSHSSYEAQKSFFLFDSDV